MINLNLWLAAAIVSVLALYGLNYFLSKRKSKAELMPPSFQKAAAGPSPQLEKDVHVRMAEMENRIAKLTADMAERDRIVADVRKDVERVIAQSRQDTQRVAKNVERQITLQTQMTQDDHKRVVVRFIKNI